MLSEVQNYRLKVVSLDQGGGIQYLLLDTVDELLDVGVLRRIK